jgi:hypothetical protein
LTDKKIRNEVQRFKAIVYDRVMNQYYATIDSFLKLKKGQPTYFDKRKGTIEKVTREDITIKFYDKTENIRKDDYFTEKFFKEGMIKLFLQDLFYFVNVVIAGFSGDTQSLQGKLEEYEDSRGTYPKKLFKKAFELQLKANEAALTLTDDDAIVQANHNLGIYNPSRLISNKGKTNFLKNIANTYTNYHKPKLKKQYLKS